jgi:hypothetical protein
LATLAPPEPSPLAPEAEFTPSLGAELAVVLVCVVEDDVVEVSDEALLDLGVPQAAVSKPTAMTPATAAIPIDLVMTFASSRTRRFEYP